MFRTGSKGVGVLPSNYPHRPAEREPPLLCSVMRRKVSPFLPRVTSVNSKISEHYKCLTLLEYTYATAVGLRPGPPVLSHLEVVSQFKVRNVGENCHASCLEWAKGCAVEVQVLKMAVEISTEESCA